MAENSHIEWTTHTFNSHWGCTKVSAGCQHCYADTLSHRYGHNVWGPTAGRKPMSEHYWKQLDKWEREAVKSGVSPRIFCNSMSDLFEGPETCQNPSAYAVVEMARERLFKAIDGTPHLTYLLLTKRPTNMINFAPDHWRGGWPANVWAGTSVENQDAAATRIPELLNVPAAVRFLSAEPLLGWVRLDEYWRDTPTDTNPDGAFGQSDTWDTWLDGGIDWVIVGGESGPGARPMHPDWVRALRDQCHAHEVAFFLKQWGEWLPSDQDRVDGMNSQMHEAGIEVFGGRTHARHIWTERLRSHRVGKHEAGRTLDGRIWNEFPEENKCLEVAACA